MSIFVGEQGYSILNLGYDKSLSKQNLMTVGYEDTTPELSHVVLSGTAPKSLTDGPLVSNMEMVSGFMQSSNFVDGAAGWQLTPTSAQLNVATSVLSLDIPDTTTTNSFHVESDGDTFWGATTFAAAPASVTKAGVALFSDATVTGTLNATAGYIGSATALVYESTGINTGTTGHIRGGQTDYDTGTGYFLGYSGAAYKLSIGIGGDVANSLTFDGTTLTVGTSRVLKKYTAGEYMKAGAAAFLENAATDISKINEDGDAASEKVFGRTSGAPEKAAQNINEPSGMRVSKIKVFLLKTGSPADNAKIGIQADSAGSPSGTFLGSATLAGGSITGSFVEYTFTLDAEVDLTAATDYWIVAERTGATSNTDYYQLDASTTGTYTNGGSKLYESGAWGVEQADPDWLFELLLTTVAGRVYNASARNAAESAAFIGFNQTAVAGLGSSAIQIAGEATGLGSLTPGTQYYLADGFGAIATSAGTVTRKVGISTATTTLLITNIW